MQVRCLQCKKLNSGSQNLQLLKSKKSSWSYLFDYRISRGRQAATDTHSNLSPCPSLFTLRMKKCHTKAMHPKRPLSATLFLYKYACAGRRWGSRVNTKISNLVELTHPASKRTWCLSSQLKISAALAESQAFPLLKWKNA